MKLLFWIIRYFLQFILVNQAEYKIVGAPFMGTQIIIVMSVLFEVVYAFAIWWVWAPIKDAPTNLFSN